MFVYVLICGFVILLVSPNQSSDISNQQCQPTSITIISRRNVTGHSITEVGLERRKTSPSLSVVTELCATADKVITWVTISAQESREISTGYDLFSGIGYYKFHPQGVTWPAARQICAEEGAHLAIINSEAEANVISQLFARFPKPKIMAGGNDDWAWLGVHELGVDREYFTLSGVALNATGFQRWYPGEPNDSRKAGDTALVAHRASGALGDALPTWTAAFICELEL